MGINVSEGSIHCHDIESAVGVLSSYLRGNAELTSRRKPVRYRPSRYTRFDSVEQLRFDDGWWRSALPRG